MAAGVTPRRWLIEYLKEIIVLCSKIASIFYENLYHFNVLWNNRCAETIFSAIVFRRIDLHRAAGYIQLIGKNELFKTFKEG
jgi:hypothetical protein